MNDQLLSPDEAFRAMFKFLEAYYARGGRKGDLAAVLSDIQIISDDRLPSDPGTWNDWLDAIRSVVEERTSPGGTAIVTAR
jgi:hypothetical protein